MASRIWASGIGAMAAVALLSAGALGQAQPGKPAAPGQDDPAALGGPSVGGGGPGAPTKVDEAPTLVQRDFDGRLKRLEGHPVAAAIDAMRLSADEQAATKKVLLDRSLAIEKVIRENL